MIYFCRSFLLNSIILFITVKDTTCPAGAIVIESWSYPHKASIKAAVQQQSKDSGSIIFLTEYFPSGSSLAAFIESSQDHRRNLNLYLEAEGLQPDKVLRIYVEQKRPITWNTADTVIKTLSGRGYRSMVLVSHWHHSRRSCEVYSKMGKEKGITVYCTPIECDLKMDSWWNSSNGLSTVFREILERVYYLLFK